MKSKIWKEKSTKKTIRRVDLRNTMNNLGSADGRKTSSRYRVRYPSHVSFWTLSDQSINQYTSHLHWNISLKFYPHVSSREGAPTTSTTRPASLCTCYCDMIQPCTRYQAQEQGNLVCLDRENSLYPIPQPTPHLFWWNPTRRHQSLSRSFHLCLIV